MSKIRVKDIIGAEVRSRIPIAALKEAIARDGCYDIGSYFYISLIRRRTLQFAARPHQRAIY